MKRTFLAVCMAAALLLAGCGGGSNGAGSTRPAGETLSSADSSVWMDKSGWKTNLDSELAPSSPEESMQGGSSIYRNTGVKLIRRAEFSIQTEAFDQSVAALNQLVAGCGGYFETASVYGGGHRDANANRRGEYIIRVPAEKYDQFFSSTGELGYVTSRTESSEDIGEAYYDTEARLKTQRTKQERLLALLEQAETMEDIISLENALSDVEYQIEQYSSTLNRYDALVGFATFNLYLSEVGRITQEVGETASLGEQMAAGFQASFRSLGNGVQDLLIWVSYHLFLTVILAAAAVAAVIMGKRELEKARKQASEKKQDL